MSENKKREDFDNSVDTGTGTAATVDQAMDTGAEEAPISAPSAPTVPAPAAVPAVAPVAAPPAPAAPADMDAASPAAVADEPPRAAEPIPPKPENMHVPEGNTTDVLGILPPEQNAMQRNAENMAFQQDLNNGSIHPKTYQDLFAEKSTLSKIGTLFAMMVGGAGAGLTHTSNSVMDMMDQQIKNDVEAQKTNQANKLTWYNAAMAHDKALADIELTNAHTAAQKLGNTGTALDNQIKEWDLRNLGMRKDAAATTSYTSGWTTVLHDRQMEINRMAPGPSQQAAQADFDTQLRPFANRQIHQAISDFSQKKALKDAIDPHPLKQALENNPRGSAIDDKRYQQMVMVGRRHPTAPPTQAIPPGDVGAIDHEKAGLETNRSRFANYHDAFDYLNQMKFGGQVPVAGALSSVFQGLGTAAAGLVGNAAGTAAGHLGGDLKNTFERDRQIIIDNAPAVLGMTKEEAAARFPAWNDDDKSRAQAYIQGVKAYEDNAIEKGATVSKRYGLYKPFPKLGYPGASKKHAKTEGIDTNTETDHE